MTRLEYYLLDVFTETRFKGNPLAVFPDVTGLPTETMLAIAAEFNLSETVFVNPPTNADCVARVRIFSPKKELDFAGHPTIGTSHLLHALGRVSRPFYLQENVGPIAIDLDLNGDRHGRFFLTTPRVMFSETLSRSLCADLLSLGEDDLATTPPQFLSAGSPLLFIQLNSPETVDRAILNASVLPHALGSVKSGGTFLFARNPLPDEPYNVYSRMFAPQIGIAEDPATGGATGPLAAYMLRYGLIPGAQEVRFESEQGVKMGRRSVLYVRVRPADPHPVIQVGGSSIIIAQGVMTLDGP